MNNTPSLTLGEWLKQKKFYRHPYYDDIKEAWDYQQKRIDERDMIIEELRKNNNEQGTV